ncbi:hypothetical protein BFJ68_g9047 [Fusarium oxysporum]|uniref:Uncharacterized protein n=1 Tax=Fusarium oxysporum TaxID=5507 RepID=A0A420QXX2_FUSOX|nr:hypothetical protein BFJ68_g9047 [Fusarium oxysporum]
MNQWTFFNKKIEALKHQAADGSAPATLVKETTSGRNRGPKPKKASSDDEPPRLWQARSTSHSKYSLASSCP